MNYKDTIKDAIFKQNNTPQKDFSGLTSFELHELIHHPFGPSCPIQLQKDIDSSLLDQIPFFRMCEELLKILQRENQVKLTPLGALQKKNLVEVYNHKFLPIDLIEKGIFKLNREQDSFEIKSARYVCEVAGLIKKRQGKLSLTKKAEKLLLDRPGLFELILTTFSFKFNWAFNDGYPDHPIGQQGNLYTIFLLLKYGKQNRLTQFYADKYLTVFHNFPLFFEGETSSEAERLFHYCYELRSFYRFTDWFGLTCSTQKKVDTQATVQASPLLEQIYSYTPTKG